MDESQNMGSARLEYEVLPNDTKIDGALCCEARVHVDDLQEGGYQRQEDCQGQTCMPIKIL